jgi:hypothetical protein
VILEGNLITSEFRLAIPLEGLTLYTKNKVHKTKETAKMAKSSMTWGFCVAAVEFSNSFETRGKDLRCSVTTTKCHFPSFPSPGRSGVHPDERPELEEFPCRTDEKPESQIVCQLGNQPKL